MPPLREQAVLHNILTHRFNGESVRLRTHEFHMIFVARLAVLEHGRRDRARGWQVRFVCGDRVVIKAAP